MFASVAPREVLARLRHGVAKPQVKPLIGVSDPYRCVPAPLPSLEEDGTRTAVVNEASNASPFLLDGIRTTAPDRRCRFSLDGIRTTAPDRRCRFSAAGHDSLRLVSRRRRALLAGPRKDRCRLRGAVGSTVRLRLPPSRSAIRPGRSSPVGVGRHPDGRARRPA